MDRIRVAVVDEHDIFRRGLIASLAEDHRVEVVLEVAEGPFDAEVDIAVVSSRAAAAHRFPCPLVVSTGDAGFRKAAVGNRVLAVLPRATLTAGQLLGAVHAAAAGLQVQMRGPASDGSLPPRLVHVLRLLAEGADTQEISRSLNYSERTIKGLISDVERELGARNRAQAVAYGIRRGLI